MNTKPLLQWDVQSTTEHLVVALSGELTRNTLLPLWKQRASFLSIKPNQPLYWDLKQLKRIDSAGFALLMELLNHYQKQTQNCLINPPNALTTLADLFNLSHWLSPFLLCEKMQNKTACHLKELK